MSLRLSITGNDKLAAALGVLSDRSYRGDLMSQIAAYGETSTQERFLDQRSPDGKSWKKSSRGGQTLRDSNRLFNSFAHASDPDNAIWGTNVIYAAIHQFGGVITPVNAEKLAFWVGGRFIQTDRVEMPARPFMGISPDDEKEIEFIGYDWMRGALQ